MLFNGEKNTVTQPKSQMCGHKAKKKQGCS